jgi:hypothetical protein
MKSSEKNFPVGPQYNASSTCQYRQSPPRSGVTGVLSLSIAKGQLCSVLLRDVLLDSGE